MKRLVGLGVIALAVAFAGTAVAADGAAIFKSKCAMCHGQNGEGGTMGAKFQGNAFVKDSKAEDIAAVLTNGRAGAAKKYKDIKMDMPKQTLTADESAAVITHIKGIAAK